jgi:hypothetical protein
MDIKDKRLRDLIQKHLDALAREIVQELTQPLLEQLIQQWKVPHEDLAADGLPRQSIVPQALIYQKLTRLWICPRCRDFSNLNRRSVTTHLRFCTAEPQPKMPRPKKKS